MEEQERYKYATARKKEEVALQLDDLVKEWFFYTEK